MTFRDTSKKNLDVMKQSRFNLQNASEENLYVGKFPINVSDFNEEHPNEYSSTPWHATYNYPKIKIHSIDTDRTSYAVVIFKNINDEQVYLHKFKSGDQIQIERLNIKRIFTVKSTIVDGEYVRLHLMNDRKYQSNDFLELDNFVSFNGYPNSLISASEATSYLNFSRRIERNLSKNMLIDFYVDFYEYEFTDSFSVKVNWEIDPSIKTTQLRWRTTPRNQKETSDISFDIFNGGYYTQIPEISLISDMGRSAKVEPVMSDDTFGSIIAMNLTDLGGAYLESPTVSVGRTLVDGTLIEVVPAEITSTLWLKTEGRIDHIMILNGGSGYTGASVSISPMPVTPPAPIGTMAEGYAEIEDGVITNIVLTNPGYGFSYGTGSTAVVVITPHGTGGTGAVLQANIDIISEWKYENPLFNDKALVIHGLKRGLPYEIQILCSPDEYFRSEYGYSDSITFSCY